MKYIFFAKIFITPTADAAVHISEVFVGYFQTRIWKCRFIEFNSFQIKFLFTYTRAVRGFETICVINPLKGNSTSPRYNGQYKNILSSFDCFCFIYHPFESSIWREISWAQSNFFDVQSRQDTAGCTFAAMALFSKCKLRKMWGHWRPLPSRCCLDGTL